MRQGKGDHVNIKMPDGQIITLPWLKEIKIGLLKAAIRKSGLSQLPPTEVEGMIPWAVSRSLQACDSTSPPSVGKQTAIGRLTAALAAMSLHSGDVCANPG